MERSLTYEERQEIRLAQQQQLEAEADAILAQAGIHPSGRKRAELPNKYWMQMRFERRIQVNGAYAGRNQR